MNLKKVGIIGCGKILVRHLEAIDNNDQYKLVSLCDSNQSTLVAANQGRNVQTFLDYKDMVDQSNIDFVVIATPNSLHYEQAKYCLENGCDVLVEKPATLDPNLVRDLEAVAKANNREIYSVLQVRLNPVVQAVKKLVSTGLLGQIRGVSLVQRWQRPAEYFKDWRGVPNIGGGTLHECGVHYLDILCYLFGKPTVVATTTYNTKHKDVEIEDTIYSILDFGDYGGTIEVNISSEPKNLECSISLLTENGFIKLGGRGLDKVVECSFLENKYNLKNEYDKIMSKSKQSLAPNLYGNYAGSCPNHPELYSKLEKFKLPICYDSLDLIKEIYEKVGVNYSE